MPDQEREISTDIREKAREVASRLDNIFFDSRSISWIDDARRIVEAALAQEREAERERCAKILDGMADEPRYWIAQGALEDAADVIRDHSGREK